MNELLDRITKAAGYVTSEMLANIWRQSQ